ASQHPLRERLARPTLCSVSDPFVAYHPDQPSLSLSFFFHGSGDPRDLHSFPTRRSSDLGRAFEAPHWSSQTFATCCCLPTARPRSEEHTSELQSRSDLVCRLLLEKKKKCDYSSATPPFPSIPRFLPGSAACTPAPLPALY